MREMGLENNRASVIGEVISGFTLSHEVFGELFYTADLAVKRLSEQVDIIPVMVSERLVDVNENCIGKNIELSGQFRSFNRREDNRNRLCLSLFAREVNFVDECIDYTKTNQIILNGYICKPVVYRKTPLGREIADLLLAVNRPYGKSDYIPCIAWGRNAKFASGLLVGDRIEIYGRMQSREYNKAINGNESKTLTAYEVSVSRLEVLYDCDK